MLCSPTCSLKMRLEVTGSLSLIFDEHVGEQSIELFFRELFERR